MSISPIGSADAVDVYQLPVRKWTNTPCTSAVMAVFFQRPGIFLASHRQRAMQGVTSLGLPEMRCSSSAPISCANSLASTWARSSSHNVPGRRGLLAESNCAKDSRWLEMAMAPTRAMSIFFESCLSAFAAPFIQSLTSCSNQPAFGLLSGTPARPSATVCPRLSQAMALVVVVDESRPMTRSVFMRDKKGRQREAASRLPED